MIMAVRPATANDGNETSLDIATYRVLTDGSIARAMCNPDGSPLNSVLNSTLTSVSANALTVGPNGTTNPTFNIDASVTNEATGVNIVGAAAASGVAVQTLSSGTNESLTLDAKGTGTVGVNTVGTTSGLVTLGNSTSLAGAAVNGPLKATSASSSALAVGLAGTTNPALQVDASTASSATGIKVKSAAAASGVAVSTVSSGTNENLTLDAKGSGTVTINGTATGNIVMGANVVFNGTNSGGTSAIVSGSGATVTLTAAQSRSTILFDRAAGIVFTLPTPAVGLVYSFYTPVSVTSNNYKVITNSGSVFLIGSVMNIKTDLTTLESIGNGSTHISVLMNGTTTGGLLGTYLRFTCVSTTQWLVEGTNLSSGTIATPFSAT